MLAATNINTRTIFCLILIFDSNGPFCLFAVVFPAAAEIKGQRCHVCTTKIIQTEQL